MLTTEAYITALLLYVLASAGGVYAFNRLFLKRVPNVVAGVISGMAFGLLAMPALPGDEARTYAPALIVAVFNGLLAGGWEAAYVSVALLVVAVVTGGVLGGMIGAFVEKKPQVERGPAGREASVGELAAAAKAVQEAK